MNYRIDLRLSAEIDIHDAAVWYRNIHPHLEHELMFCVEEAFSRLVRRPLINQKVYGEVRRIVLRRFPYNMYHIIHEDAVVVFAVVHSHRHPKIWKHRIQ